MIERRWMERAVELARRSLEEGTYPVGAVLTDAEGRLVAEGRNRVLPTGDPTAHAEVEALRGAAAWFRAQGSDRRRRRGEALTLYTTLEPCLMCGGAILFAQVGAVAWGSDDPYGGSHRILQAQSHYDGHRGRWSRSRTFAEPFPDLAREVRALMRQWEERRGRLEEFAWPEPEEAR